MSEKKESELSEFQMSLLDAEEYAKIMQNTNEPRAEREIPNFTIPDNWSSFGKGSNTVLESIRWALHYKGREVS